MLTQFSNDGLISKMVRVTLILPNKMVILKKKNSVTNNVVCNIQIHILNYLSTPSQKNILIYMSYCVLFQK